MEPRHIDSTSPLKIYRINSFGFKETTKINRCDLTPSLKRQGWKISKS